MATHSSILAWRNPWTEEPGGLHSPWGRKESDTTERLTHTYNQTQGQAVELQDRAPALKVGKRHRVVGVMLRMRVHRMKGPFLRERMRKPHATAVV